MSNSVATILRSILQPANGLNTEVTTAIISIGSAMDQINVKQATMQKEIEEIRKLARTNWLMFVNLPLPYGVSKINAIQQLCEKLSYGKPIFDADRDVLATDMLYVNRNGGTCNLSVFVAQRHFDHFMSAIFQRNIVAYNKTVAVDQKVTVGRVLTAFERADYENACALKRLIIRKMQEKRRTDPHAQMQFVLVDKRTIRLRIDKQYFTLDDAAVRYGITTEEIDGEKKRHGNSDKRTPEKAGHKRPGGPAMTLDSTTAKMAKIIPLN